jgi:translocation and assembly module TamB
VKFHPKKILHKIITWSLKGLGILIILLLVVWGLLQTQWGKNVVKNQAVKYLKNKLNTNVAIAGITVEWLTHIKLTGIYIEDKEKRKLLSVGELDINYDISDIFSNKLDIPVLKVDELEVNIFRQRADSNFNFSFIPAAFSTAGETESQDTSSVNTFVIGLGKVSLNRVHFLMDDQYGGQHHKVTVASFNTELDKFDLNNLHFHTKHLYSDSLDCDIKFFSPYAVTKQKESSPLDLLFGADSVSLSNSFFSFENPETEMKVQSNAQLLGGSNINYSQAKLNVQANYLTLRNHTTKVQIKTVGGSAADSMIADTSLPFTYVANKIDIINSNVEFNDKAAPVLKGKQMDYGHLAFSNINLHTDSTGYNGKKYFSFIKQMNAAEKSGFQLKQFSTHLQYADSFVQLQNIVLKTPYNQLQGNAFVSYPSIAAITTRPAATNLNLDIKNSSLQLDELLFFNNSLAGNASLRPLLRKKISLNTKVNGTLEKLSIPSLLIQQANTRLQASAMVYNPTDVNKLSIDITLKEFTGSRTDLLALLPPQTIPDSILHYIPAQFSLKGIFKGVMNDFYTDMQLRSSEGNAAIKGSVKNITDENNAVYDVALSTSNIDLAKLMNDSSYGNVSAVVKLKGRGYKVETMEADYDVDLQELKYNGNNYKNVSVNGSLKKKKLRTQLRSNDPDLQLSSDIFYDMTKAGGSFKTNTSIFHLNLAKFGFTKDTVFISGKINADFPVLDTVTLKGQADISGFTINYAGKKIAFGTVFINADKIANTQSIDLKTSFADAKLKGKYSLNNIVPAIQKVLNSYLYTESAGTIYAEKVNADLSLNVYLPDSISRLVPGLKKVDPFSAIAHINTDSLLLNFNTVLPKIQYRDYRIDTVKIFGNNKASSGPYEQLDFGFTIKQVTSPSFTLPESGITGNILHGRINGKLQLLDEENDLRYAIPFRIVNEPLRPYASIPDSLFINGKKWSVNDDNIIYLSPKELKGSKLVISNGPESLSVITEGAEQPGLPLTLKLDNFRLRNISELVIADSALLKGNANGYFSVTSLQDFSFISDLTVDSLKVKEVLAGNFKMNVKQQPDNKLGVDMSLIGNGNNVTLTGTFDVEKNAPYLSLDMQPLNVKLVEPFAVPYLSSLTGKMQGSIDIHGTLDKPDIIGAILLDSIQGVYKDYNTLVKIPSSGINFENGVINFTPLNFTDDAGNKGMVTGDIFTSNYRDYRFDLRVKTKHFKAVGEKKFPDQVAYGPTYADAYMTISGNMKKIEVNGAVDVVDSSSFTYVYRPDEEAPKGEGLMEFFDPAHPEDTLVLQKKMEAAAAALQLATNIYVSIEPKTSVTIMLDETTGDQLNIYGTANLNMSMSAGGDMYLTGSYIAEKGSYDLSIASIIRKEFEIQKGSTITWTGDPMKAELNITAVYNTKTSAAELLTDQQSLPGIDKQQMNFDVYLILNKEMLNPQISFKIDMDPADQQLYNGVVYTRIKQINAIEAELNKQVMGLLALNRFIADNPFSSLTGGGGSSFETKAYATAGRLLTQELTELVGNAIKGVNISFGLDINEDYTTGSAQRNTNLKVGVSKSMANNRLIVYVGSSFALEGQNQNASALAGLAGDVTAEYLMTRDGHYRLKAYRINQTELTFQAAIVKTGVSFVVVLEFNKFKNIFKKKRNR